MKEKLSLTLRQIRIHHWIKNLLIFFPLFFSGNFTHITQLKEVSIVFVIFCLTASSIYIINDLVDLEDDRKHPIKRNRPIASGKLTINYIYMVLLGLFTTALLLTAYLRNYQTALIIILYFIGNLLYSSIVKHIPILEMFLLSSFYILRLYSGAFIIGIEISGWLFTTVLFGTLAMIAGKRYTEIRNSNIRKVLESYNKETLHSLFLMFITLTSASFALYEITVIKDQLIYIPQILIFTFIISRYYLLTETSDKAETPEVMIIEDAHLLMGFLLLGLSSVLFIY